jgi:hypothetical protein
MNRKSFVIAAGLVGVVAATACEEKRSDLGDTVAPNAYGFQLLGAATNLPRGSVRMVFKRNAADARPDSFIVTLSGLDSLDGGFYVPWAGDSLGTSFKRLTGALSASRRDTALDVDGNIVATTVAIPTTDPSMGNKSAIKNGNPRTTWTWIFTRASSGLAASDSMQTFLITLEDTETPTEPHATRRPLWARRGNGSPSSSQGTANAALRFGNWGPLVGDERVFSATPARGRGIFQSDVFMINDSTLVRPPMGYYYAVFMAGAFYGVTSDTLSFGAQTSPWPRRHLSQYDADATITDPLVVLDTPPSILAGSMRVSADTITGLPAEFPYKTFTEVWVTLAPKLGFANRMGTARVLRGTIPFVITSGQLQ